MIGFAVIAPKSVALRGKRKVQRTRSRGIVRASSVVAVAVAARRFEGSPFAAGQDPAAGATEYTAKAASTNAIVRMTAQSWLRPASKHADTMNRRHT
jgi:hypothetical protein